MNLTAEEVLNRLSETIKNLKKEAKPNLQQRYVVWSSGASIGVYLTDVYGNLIMKSRAYSNHPSPLGNVALFRKWLDNAESRAQQLADELNSK